jgi:hypothetical protein
MLTGEAVGTVAALAVQQNIEPRVFVGYMYMLRSADHVRQLSTGLQSPPPGTQLGDYI